jgi:hypothetical protein
MPHDDRQLTVTVRDGALTIAGAALDAAAPGGAWTAHPLDEKRVLIAHAEGRAGAGGDIASVANELCKELLHGLHRSHWSGIVTIDTFFGVKKLYFGGGDVVFAGSNTMDDRLGEVIYREAKITLDELTDSAAQVTKSRKFGQVLLSSGIFSNVQLWQALKLQVKQIVRSVFMVDRVFIELSPGVGLAPTEVHFDEGTEHLLADSYGFGSAFRDFLSRLRAESEVVLLKPKEEMLRLYKPGTFTGDLVGIIAEQSNVQELLNTSKLIDSYTIAALINLVNKGLCTIKPAIETDKKAGAAFAPLKAKVDAYGYVLQSVRKAFTDAKRPFPVADVVAFASDLNPEGFESLFLDQNGTIGRECVNSMFSQCHASPERQRLLLGRIESLIKFLLAVAADNLDFGVAKALRQDYRSISP